MRVLKVRFRTNREFLEACRGDLAEGGLFCPTTTPLAPDTEVICEVVVPALPNKVLIRARVRSWRPALPRLRVRAGAMVDIAPEESEKRDFLLQAVTGQRPQTARRRHVRLPIDLPVKWRVEGTPDFAPGWVSEISVGGALLRGAGTLLPLGTAVIVEVTPPGAVRPIAISGKVAYHTPAPGSGLKFQVRDGGGTRRLRELVRRLRAS